MADHVGAPETIICSEGNLSIPSDLRILHFNDVYHVEPSSHEPTGGITRFQTLCNHYRQDARFQGQSELIALFSGDGFGPSLESSVTKGGHMIPILNGIPTTAACVGNHDLDLGVPQFEHLAAQCKFPWLLANVIDPALGVNISIGHAQKTVLLTSSNGIKIGLIGLAEQEWLEAVNALPPNLIYLDPVITANELIPDLRARGAEVIIALCHQREVHDIRLAEDTPRGLIDVILGGHDHHYRYSKIKDTHVLCSGSDFKQLSYVEARRRHVPQITSLIDKHHEWDISITRCDVVSAIPEDSETLQLMDHLFASLKAKLEKPVGHTSVPLDSRFTTVRTRESNLGNFVSDLMRYYYDTDCAIMAGGTIRGDVLYPPGVLRLKDIMDCFPFEDPTVVVQVKGKAILEALENGVCHYPALEGRFPQVSNIHFVFDPSRAPFHRIVSAKLGGEPLDLDREYSVATRDYMVNGGDGYTSLTLRTHGGLAIPLIKEENGILLSMLLRQHFMSSLTVGRWKNWGTAHGQHWEGVHERLQKKGSVHVSAGGVQLLTPLDVGDFNKMTSSEKEHVPGLVGKCLRQESFRPPVCPTPHGDNASMVQTLCLSHEQPLALQIPRLMKTTTGKQEVLHLSDSENDSDDNLIARGVVATEPDQSEREVLVARKALRKWYRLAGLNKGKGHELGYERGEELGVAWTRGICPRVEGRIKIVGIV